MPPLPLMLVVMAGLPGVGKSSIAHGLANELGICKFELDRIEAPLLSRISGDTLVRAAVDYCGAPTV